MHVELSKLNQQAFPQVARAYAGRVEALNDLQGAFNFAARHFEEFRRLANLAVQIAVFVDVANQKSPDFPRQITSIREG